MKKLHDFEIIKVVSLCYNETHCYFKCTFKTWALHRPVSANLTNHVTTHLKLYKHYAIFVLTIVIVKVVVVRRKKVLKQNKVNILFWLYFVFRTFFIYIFAGGGGGVYVCACVCGGFLYFNLCLFWVELIMFSLTL